MFSSNSAQPHDHSPSLRVEKPRVPPPERPNIPPPDKPPVAERPKGTPPAVPVPVNPAIVFQPTSPVVTYSVLPAITQSSQPSVPSSAPSNNLPYYQPRQPSSYPYQPQIQCPNPPQSQPCYSYQPQHTLPYLPQPVSSSPDVSGTSNVMSASMSSLNLPSGEKPVSNSTSTSCISSGQLALAPQPLQIDSSSSPKLCPNLNSGDSSANPPGTKGHSRQLSTGSRPVPPQRPQPPIPPKKVEMKSTEFWTPICSSEVPLPLPRLFLFLWWSIDRSITFWNRSTIYC